MAIASFALIGTNPTSAFATTYLVNRTISALSVDGSITTDDTIGILDASSIVSWSLTLSGFGAPRVLDTGNSNVFVASDHLTATSTGLFFDFTQGNPTAFLAFVSNPNNVPSASHVQWTNLFFSNFSISINNNGGPPGTFSQETITGVSGTRLIGSPVPEPSTWAMMILGFAGVGYMTYRRRKVAALAT